MKKVFTLATTRLAVSGLASAQETPVAAAGPLAPRTGLYTGVTVGNAAADNTVDDFSRRPTLIGDKQYIAGYGGADLVDAAYSFKGMGWNWFGSVTALAQMSQIRAGLGNGTAWGAGAIVGVHREYAKAGANADELTTFYEPSGFGLFGDVSLGAGDIYFQVGWNTGLPSTPGLQNSTHLVPATGDEVDNLNHSLTGMVGWKKDATTEGTHAWNVEANYSTEMTNFDAPPVDTTLTQITLLPSWGYILRMNSSYAVFLGTYININYTQAENRSSYNADVMPNIAFQKQFGKGFEGFAGFSVTASWEGATSDAPVDGAESSDVMTGESNMFVGLRWVKDNFALEGGLKESVLANGPYLIGGNAGQGLFYNIGLAMGF